MAENMTKRVPKASVKFDITLSTDQKEAKSSILEHPVSFILGKPGSGKTLVAVQTGLDLVFKRQVNKLVITRPTISSEDNGYLPGSLQEKLDPWLVPIRDNLDKVYSKEKTIERMYEDKIIEIVPLSFFRGRTFSNAFCIVDEFQNLSKDQLAMCIGRLGKDSWMVFTGDAGQIDLKRAESSAFHMVDTLYQSPFVYKTVLKTNHRHEALEDIFKYFYNNKW